MGFYPSAPPITEMLVNMLPKLVIRVAYIVISLVVLAMAVDWAPVRSSSKVQLLLSERPATEPPAPVPSSQQLPRLASGQIGYTSAGP